MSAGPAAGRTMEGALAEAAEWRLLGLLFERPRAGWREAVEEVSREVRDGELRAAASEAREAGGAEEGIYLRVMGPGGAVPAREAGYLATGDLGTILADISAFYEAFAYRPSAEDPLDHVAVEAGFAGYLRLKEAYARARGDEEGAATSKRAFDRFNEAHLRVIAGPMFRRLRGTAPPYLVRAAASLLARTGDAPDPSWGGDAPDQPGETGEAGLCCGEPFPGPGSGD